MGNIIIPGGYSNQRPLTPYPAWAVSAISNGAAHVWVPSYGLRDLANPTNNDYKLIKHGPDGMVSTIGPSGFNDDALLLGEDCWFEVPSGTVSLGYTTPGSYGGSFHNTLIEVVYRQDDLNHFWHIANQQNASGPDTDIGSWGIEGADPTGLDHTKARVLTGGTTAQTDASLDDYHQFWFYVHSDDAGGAGHMTLVAGVDGDQIVSAGTYPASNTERVQIGYRRDVGAEGGLILCGFAVYPSAGTGGAGNAAIMASQFTATGI